MNRLLAFIGALLFAFISIASACTAAPGQWIRFTLEPQHGGGQEVRASFRYGTEPNDNHNWSTEFRASDLVGLDLAAFHSGETRPLRFSIAREAGRLDCAGRGGESFAAGNCSFTADPAFSQALLTAGIERPTIEQSLGLMAVNARRELIEALAAARYPTPSINELMSLSALGVNDSYIRDMAHAGYRPRTIEALVEFKAMNITPEWIAGFARIGYADFSGDQLAQLKAMDITPEFIAGFDRIGYRHLPVEQLLELKAMDITPDFVSRIAAADNGLPPVQKLVELKSLDRRR